MTARADRRPTFPDRLPVGRTPLLASPSAANTGAAPRRQLRNPYAVDPTNGSTLFDKAPCSQVQRAGHLYALSEPGIVTHQRRGRERIWQLDPRASSTRVDGSTQISDQWDEAIGRLKVYLEDDS